MNFTDIVTNLSTKHANIKYEASHYVLAVLYFFLLVECVIFFIIRYPIYHKLVKCFYSLIFTLTVLRIITFIADPLTRYHNVQLREAGVIILYAIMILPTYLLITVYSITLILWLVVSDLENQEISNTKKFLPLILLGNVVFYIVVIVLFFADAGVRTISLDHNAKSDSFLDLSIQAFSAIIYLVSFVFIVFLITQRCRHTTHGLFESNRPVLVEKYELLRDHTLIILVYIAVTMLVKGILIGIEIFGKRNFNSWYFHILYYFFLEIISLAYVMIMMHHHETSEVLGEADTVGEAQTYVPLEQ